MKAFLLFLTFISLAHAESDCSDLLSPKSRLEVSIRDLSKLRYELDSSAALATDTLTVQLLKTAYDRKYKEILALEPALDTKVREEIQKIQSEEMNRRGSVVQKNNAEENALEQAITSVSTIGRLQNERSSSAQETLSTGEVLLMGGYLLNRIDFTNELFDPATGMSKLVVNLPKHFKSYGHTLLKNDTVLIAGGSMGRPSDGSWGKTTTGIVRVLDPKNNTLKKVGTLKLPRFNHKQVLLKSGKVMLIGGGNIIYLGGTKNFQSVSDFEVFDPATRTSEIIPNPNRISLDHCIALLDGSVFCHDGQKAYVIDPAQNKFLFVGHFSGDREESVQSLLPDGRVVVSGGHSDEIEIFDPIGQTIKVSAKLAYERIQLAQATLSDGRVAFFGGKQRYGVSRPDGLVEVEIFDPETETVSVLLNLKHGRTGHHLVAGPDNTLYIIGGRNQNSIIYDVVRIKVGRK